MRLALPLVAALLLLPLAAADQAVTAGPAAVTTQNGANGDGDCEMGANGGQSRFGEARLELTPHDDLVALFAQNCSTFEYEDEHGAMSYDSHNGVVMVGRASDDNVGPVGQLNWMDSRYEDPWQGEGRVCFTCVYLSGSGVSLGCLPNGERWPMAPTLP